MKLLIITKKELIDQIRDKRTIIAALLMPALIVPLLLFLMTKSASDGELNVPIRVIMQSDEVLSGLILEAFPDTRFLDPDSPADAIIKRGEAELELEFAKSGGSYTSATIHYDSARRISALSYVRMHNLLGAFFKGQESAADGPRITAAPVRGEKENKTLLTLSVILPVFLVVFAASSTMSSVIDMSSGEKERATIETLISCNISRTTIILGKTLAASAVGITAVVSLLSGLIICSQLFPRITGGLSLLEFSGAGNVLLMLLMTSVSVLFFSTAGMAIGLYAKSVKEGTILTLPVVVLSSALSSGLIGGDPFSIDTLYFLIPVLNLSFVIRSVIYSRVNDGALLISVLVNLAYAALFLIISGRLLKKETVICRS